jgi:beta-lactamase superfamily II metal-dependent hydrolase
MNVKIRMYNTGFGDCFLLTFPAADRARKVLIDCGRHTLSKGGPKLSRVVQQVLADVQERDGPRIDIVIATHRHQDHVEGLAAEGWQDVQVSEVWMPWTEHPTDREARDICDRQSKKAQKLREGIAALAMQTGNGAYLLGYAGNNLTNAAAMKLLHKGFQGSPMRRFLPEPEPESQRLTPPALPGVEVYVLGPSRDPDVMREMEPPGEESFLRAWQMGVPSSDDRPAPFDPRWSLTRAVYEQRIGPPLDVEFPIESERQIAQDSDDALLELAARLEDAVNSTSLVLLFHLGEAWMLFPGDAQWGTWNAILNNPLHAGLLEALTFYKVGHHGSHNATPRSFVERFVNEKVRAMLPYGRVDKWPTIPKPGLLKSLTEKQAEFARSDQEPATGSPFSAVLEGGDVLYIDYDVPV